MTGDKKRKRGMGVALEHGMQESRKEVMWEAEEHKKGQKNSEKINKSKLCLKTP